MSEQDINIIRAWRDKRFRHSLSSAEQEQLPEHPAGTLDLENEELEEVNGGTTWPSVTITLSSAAVCSIVSNVTWSYINGGTCQLQTVGCC